jgi:hypothetical protein
MKASVGDWLVMKGLMVGRPDRRGLITDIRNDDGTPPYVVHWLDDDHMATVFPGPDSIVVTAAEQRAADERLNRRLASHQQWVTHRLDG